MLQRQAKATDHNAGPDLPPIVRDVLSSPGQPLDATTRSFMEPRFGRDFSDVRVHTDGHAAESARAVNAEAYTVGNRIAFDSGRYRMGSSAGRRLIAHELAHVVQQSAGHFQPTARHEVEADQAAARVTAGQTTATMTGAQTGLQRQEKAQSEEQVPSVFGNAIVNSVVSHLPMGAPTHIAAAAVTGLVSGLAAELKGTTGTLLMSNLASFRAKDIPALSQGYVVGIAEGVVSPITDLFGLARFGEQIQGMAINLGLGALSGRTDLIQELRDLAKPLDAAAAGLNKALAKMREDPVKTLNALLALPGKVMQEAPKKAYGAGLEGGHSMAKSLLEPWQNEKKPKPPESSGVLGAISNKYDELKDKVIDVPWAKVGNKIGYAIGFAVVNVALLFLTEGVGNAIVEGANALGKLSKSLGAFARSAEAIADLMRTTGTVIAEIERLINLGMSKILKPLEPILEPLLKPFAEFVEKLQGFLKKLLGATEKAAAEAGTTATVKGAASVAKPHAPAAPAHTPAPALKEAPHAPPRASNAHDPGAGPAQSPSAPKKPPESQKFTPPETKVPEPPMVQKPGSEGHHVQVSERGVEVCSPPPCPLLNIEYAKELKAEPKLDEAWREIQKLRTSGSPSDLEKAAERSAALQKNLASIRTRERIFSHVDVSAAQRRRLEKIIDIAEHSEGKITDEGAEKLVGRLKGKSKAEIDAAIREFETEVKLEEARREIQKLRASGSAGDLEKAAQRSDALEKNLASTRTRERIFSNVDMSPVQRRRLEDIIDAAEHSGSKITDEGAEKLIGRLKGKSKAEIDAAIKELGEAVQDLPGNLGGLTKRGGAEPVGLDRITAPKNKPGVQNTAAPKTGGESPAAFQDMASETPSHTRDTLGTKQPNPKTALGVDVHTHFEDLPKFVRDDIEKAFPGDIVLPPGLEKEVRVPDTRLPAARQPRMDRVDRKKGIIYEIGPDHLSEEKLAEAKVYAELMDRFDRLPGGRKWTPEVVTYNQRILEEFAEKIGWKPKKPGP